MRAALHSAALRLRRLFDRPPVIPAAPEPWIPLFRTFDTLERYAKQLVASDGAARRVEASLTPAASFFAIAGTCNVCRAPSRFYVDRAADGRPLWRETLTCRRCRLSNRKRTLVEYLTNAAPSKSTLLLAGSDGYFLSALRARFREVIASEYVSSATTPGTRLRTGVRHEDLTALSFADRSVDVLCATEVLEHIFEYGKALSEAYRVLRPGGLFVLTVPFLRDRRETVTRALAIANMPIVHLEEPEYHEDPGRSAGILCFYHFGWDLLDALRDRGFDEVGVVECWSPHGGHVGDCLLITGRKPAR